MNYLLAGANIDPTPIVDIEHGTVTVLLEVVTKIDGAPTGKFEQVDKTSYVKPITTPIPELLAMKDVEAENFINITYRNA